MHPNHPKDSSPPEPPNDKTNEPGQSPDGDAEDQHAPRAVAEHLVEPPSTSSEATPPADGHDPSAHLNIKSFQPTEDQESLLQYYFNLDSNPTHITLKNLAKQLGIPGQIIKIYRWFHCQRMKDTVAEPRESRSTSSASEEELRRGGGNVSTSQQDSGQAMAAPSQADQTTDMYLATNPLSSIPHRTPPLNTSSSQIDAFDECFLYGPSTSEQTTSITEAPSVNKSALVATLSQMLGSLLPCMECHGVPSTISGDVTPAPDVTFTDEPLDHSQESSHFPSPAKQRKIDNADGSGTGASPLAAGSDTMDSLFMLTDEMLSVISQSPSHSSSMTPGVAWHTDIHNKHYEDDVGYSFPQPTTPPKRPESQEGSSYQWPDILQLSSEMNNASELAREGDVQLEIDESDDQKKVDDDDSSPGEDA